MSSLIQGKSSDKSYLLSSEFKNNSNSVLEFWYLFFYHQGDMKSQCGKGVGDLPRGSKTINNKGTFMKIVMQLHKPIKSMEKK